MGEQGGRTVVRLRGTCQHSKAPLASVARRGLPQFRITATSCSDKRGPTGRLTHAFKDDTRRDALDRVDLFHTPKRKQTNNGMLSPGDLEERQHKLKNAGVSKTTGTSILGFRHAKTPYSNGKASPLAIPTGSRGHWVR